MSERVAVIGGGISGLTAAYFALQKGFSVALFEGTEQLGGLAGSFDFGGVRIEKYYHFICGGDHTLLSFADRLGISNEIRFVPTKMGFFYHGKYYPFSNPLDLMRFSPLPWLSRLKFGKNVISSKYSKSWESLDGITARDWVTQRISEKAYQVIWHPLLKVKFGQCYDRISAAWVWHRIHRVASSRKRLFAKEKMGYFHGGSETLITAVENKIKEMGGLIHLRSRVRKIVRDNDKFKVYIDPQEHYQADRVMLAVPLPIASELLKDLHPEFSRKLSSIDFIGIVCGIFRLKEKVTDAFWVNINDPEIAANGLIEYTNLNPLEEISPDSIIYVPFYVPVEDPWFSMDVQSLEKSFFDMLKIVNPRLTQETIRDFKVFRTNYAQAICTIDFKDRMPPVKTPVNNLFLLDSTQLYPSDRTLSALIGLAEKTVTGYF